LRAGREPVTVVGGPRGAAGAGRGAAGAFAAGPVFRRKGIFALFARKGKIRNSVVFA